MYKQIFLIFLLPHILGDFYLQTDDMSKQKNAKLVGLFKHAAIYAITYILFSSIIAGWQVLPYCIGLGILHFLIDLIKCLYIKVQKEDILFSKERKLYIIDQILHLSSIAIISYIFISQGNFILIAPYLHNILKIVGLPGRQLLSWVLLCGLIWKPANITIKKLLKSYKPIENPEANISTQTGGFIGLLERLVILVLLSINQYSAIGLVLTAKSIARYDKIAKDQEFAEYYLLGTLLSTAFVIIVYLVIT
jgi:hypothetical protein